MNVNKHGHCMLPSHDSQALNSSNTVTGTNDTSSVAIDKICDLNSKLVKAKIELDNKSTEMQELKNTLNKLEAQLHKQKEDIKTLKTQSTHQKKELVTLTKDRDDAVREREHNFRERMNYQNLHQQVLEENHILLARVESLKLQRDTSFRSTESVPTPAQRSPTPREVLLQFRSNERRISPKHHAPNTHRCVSPLHPVSALHHPEARLNFLWLEPPT